MANYRATAVSGEQWQRCAAAVIMNPYQGQPEIRMDEESIAAVNGETYAKAMGSLCFTFDPADTFALLDPDTGAPTGEVTTQAAVYQAIYSLYIAKAVERDNAEAVAD